MTPLTVSHVVALSILASYFFLIFCLFCVIFTSIWRKANTQSKPKRIWLFIGLTGGSFAHTWYWMFRFMFWSFQNFEETRGQLEQEDILFRVATWLIKTTLFKQAWSAACNGPLNWWWSEQLCLFTVGGFTVFLFMQRGRIPHLWAYMLLGQVVAISVAWSLVNVAMVAIPPPPGFYKNGKSTLAFSVTVPVILSLLAVSLSPYTSPVTFLPNLLAIHALSFLPLLPLPSVGSARVSPHSTSFYTLITLLSVLLRIRTTFAVLSALHITSSPFFSLEYPMDLLVILWNAPEQLYRAVWDTLRFHPAQASIGWDIIWTSIIWLAWGFFGDRPPDKERWRVADGMRKVLPTIVASVGVVAPMEFGYVLREDVVELESDKKEQ